MPIEVTELAKTYGEVSAIRHVSLTIRPGERVVLLGPNGSGKSTLLRCLVRLEQPTAGTVTIGAHPVTTLDAHGLRALRREVGFVWQTHDLVGYSTVFANVLHGALGRGGIRSWWPATAPGAEREFAYECLDRVGLAHLARRRASTLSGGQQQRVAIARMLMQRPRLILADEPIASLDPRAATEVMDLLWNLATETGATVVCTLHQVDAAKRYADRILGMRGGHLVLDRPPADISDNELDLLYAGAGEPPATIGTPVTNERKHT
ncbi:phosphonate ABC transporter ATP-binding protein [Streptomyces sp. NPDC004752]